MPRQRIIHELVNQYNLSENDIYLLNFIPVIEMMWADGKVQQEEVSILHEYAIQWMAHLATAADGEMPVDDEQVNRFIQRFIQTRPSAALLSELAALAFEWLNASPELVCNQGKDRELYEFCLDIAAAAVHSYPYGRRTRIDQAEKALLNTLLVQLGLAKSTT